MRTQEVQTFFASGMLRNAVRAAVWTAICALDDDVISLFARCLAGTLNQDSAGIVALSARVHGSTPALADDDQLQTELVVIAGYVRKKIDSASSGDSSTQARKRYVESQEGNWRDLSDVGVGVSPESQLQAQKVAEFAEYILDHGRLPVGPLCTMRKQPTSLDKQHVEREVGNQLFVLEDVSGKPLMRGGEVIQEQYTRLMGILSFGCKPAPVGRVNPKAQTEAVYGKVKNAAGVFEIWTTTLGGVLAILMYIVRVVTVFPVSKVEAVLRLLYTSANQLMVTHHYNFETAMRYAMRDIGEPEFIRGLPSETSGDDPSNLSREKRARDEMKKLKAENSQLNTQLKKHRSSSLTPQKSLTTGNPQGNQVCRDHNNFGCRRQTCNFLHKCEKCGDTSGAHGRWDCPKK